MDNHQFDPFSSFPFSSSMKGQQQQQQQQQQLQLQLQQQQQLQLSFGQFSYSMDELERNYSDQEEEETTTMNDMEDWDSIFEPSSQVEGSSSSSNLYRTTGEQAGVIAPPSPTAVALDTRIDQLVQTTTTPHWRLHRSQRRDSFDSAIDMLTFPPPPSPASSSPGLLLPNSTGTSTTSTRRYEQPQRSMGTTMMMTERTVQSSYHDGQTTSMAFNNKCAEVRKDEKFMMKKPEEDEGAYHNWSELLGMQAAATPTTDVDRKLKSSLPISCSSNLELNVDWNNPTRVTMTSSIDDNHHDPQVHTKKQAPVSSVPTATSSTSLSNSTTRSTASYSVPRPPTASTGSSSNNNESSFFDFQESKWNERYQELVQYKKKYGHVSVPNKWMENYPLAQWVKRQRYQYRLKQEGKNSTLGQRRQVALDQLGFIWDLHDTVWEERLKELQIFVQIHGHGKIPIRYKPNPDLAIWAKCQRRYYKNYCTSQACGTEPRNIRTEERISKLIQAGFVFSNRTSRRPLFSRSCPDFSSSPW